MAVIQTDNISMSNTTRHNLPSPTPGGVQTLLRVSTSGCYVGANNVDQNDGYELVANQEYKFNLYPVAGSSSSADNQIHVYNNSGGSSVLNYAVTPLT